MIRGFSRIATLFGIALAAISIPQSTNALTIIANESRTTYIVGMEDFDEIEPGIFSLRNPIAIIEGANNFVRFSLAGPISPTYDAYGYDIVDSSFTSSVKASIFTKIYGTDRFFRFSVNETKDILSGARFIPNTDGASRGRINATGQSALAGSLESVVLRRIPVNVAFMVPEPQTWLMMIGGFGLVGAAVRKHRFSKTVVQH